ncbi:Glutathione S-transferase, N-terminal, partial [Dillenia turbinata]
TTKTLDCSAATKRLLQEMAGEGVKLIGFWGSPFALRVKWALKLKEIQYEYLEEDLPYKKSDMLLKYNPVYKKVPVLVHDEKPIAESLVIIEYIEDKWKQNPLLPEDPYERAKARFWAKFADEKCVPAIMLAFRTTGEAQEKAVREAREHLKTLESGLAGKRFFGGESIGFVDIAAGWIGIWARVTEEIAGIKLIDEEVALLDTWFKDFLELPVIKECLPPRDRLLELNQGFHKMLTAAST